MKIDVSKIKYDLGSMKDIQEKIELDDLNLGSRIIELPEPLEVDLQITNSGSEYLVMGKLHVQATVECSRCLEKFSYPMNIDFYEEIPKDTLENDNTIDITEALYEHLILDLPIKTVCKDECKGLCPQCGQNLNDHECGCNREVIDPRLAKLQELKDLLDEEND